MSKEQGQGGFTLIELIVVIVILGILAAFAIPRFIGLSTDARVADLQGMAGSLKEAATMVYGKARAENVAAGGNITINGQQVALATSTYYPAASNGETVWSALIGGLGTHFGYAGNGLFQLTGATNSAECSVQYSVTPGTTASTSSVTATVTSSGC